MEFNTPEYTALLASSDQQCAMFNRMVDCYVKGAHGVAGTLVDSPANTAAAPYGTETQCTVAALIRQSIKGKIPYDDLCILFAVALCRLAENEAGEQK